MQLDCLVRPCVSLLAQIRGPQRQTTRLSVKKGTSIDWLRNILLTCVHIQVLRAMEDGTLGSLKYDNCFVEQRDVSM